MAFPPTVIAETRPHRRRFNIICFVDEPPKVIAIFMAIVAAAEPDMTPQMSPITSLQMLDT